MHIPVAEARRGFGRGGRTASDAKPAANNLGTAERNHGVSRTAKVASAPNDGLTATEQSARQQGLHIASPIGDQVNGHPLPNDPVDQPVGLEEYLPVLLITEAA